MRFHRSYVRAVLLSLSFVALFGAWSTRGDDVGPRLSKIERQQLWSKNISALESCRRSAAPGEVTLPAGDLYDDPRIDDWISDYRETVEFLSEARRKDFKKYVDLAKQNLEDGKTREALHWANKGLQNAPDKDAFLKSDWLDRLVERAVAKAEEYLAAPDSHSQEVEQAVDEAVEAAGESKVNPPTSKWMKAHSLYYNLSALFEDRKEFDKRRRECLTHARLDVVYAKDDHRKWAERFEGIDEQNVYDTLERVSRYYVEEADFREMTEAGIAHLLLLAESDVMRETFTGLADRHAREDYVRRLGANLKNVRRTERMSAREAKDRFRRAATINRQTVALPTQLIVYEFMIGALEPLDEFTSVIWPIEFREFDKHTRGDFVGVGISITGGGERPIRVATPLEDAPAYRAGIVADDEITHVNGASLEGISLNKAVQMITGPIGTDVTLTVYRPSDDRSTEYVLKRALVKIVSVKGLTRLPDDPEHWDYMIDKDLGIAYVRMGSFQENTIEQLREAIDEALAEGARGLILDLRFNPGGLLRSAVEVSQLFLESGKVVVSTRGLPGREPKWNSPEASNDGPYTKIPMIVLVNEYSASASEIVAGALRDFDRAVILGERTYGKFSVQKLMRLSRGSETHLKLTTARYFLPSGESLHHEEGATEWGVAPAVNVELAPKELQRVMSMRRASDVLPAPGSAENGDDAEVEKPDADADTDEEKTEPDGEDAPLNEDEEEVADADDDDDKLDLEPDPNELPDIDVQLDTAVLLVRLHLVGETTLRLAAVEQEKKGRGTAVRNP